MATGKRHTILFIALAMVMVLAFVAQLLLGSVKIPFNQVLAVITGYRIDNETWSNIIIESRLPGALAALVAGAGLSISGLQMQTLFRNPVADPYVLGISSGASLGVAIFILGASAFGLSSQAHVISAWGIIFAAALGAVAIFLINFICTKKNISFW